MSFQSVFFRTILFTLFSLLISINVNGAFLKDVPVKVKQPNGNEISCFASGDEFYNWLHDEQNFTIIKNKQTGYYVYAIIKEEMLVASDYTVGLINPEEVGLEPGINIFPDKSMLKSFSDEDEHNAPKTGDYNNIVIFIRFENQAEYTSSISDYQEMFNGDDFSMKGYFAEISDNKLNVSSTFYPASSNNIVVSYKDEYPREYYIMYDSVTNPIGYKDDEMMEREHTLLKNAIENVKTQIENTNLEFDSDEDGYVDNICFIVQGNTEGWSNLLWPHQWSLYSKHVYIDGKRVSGYNFQLDERTDVGVLCHEMFHSLGAPDLYHYSYDELSPVSGWDLMASSRAQHTSAWLKHRYGQWFNTIPEIVTDGIYKLPAVSDHPFACYKIAVPESANEFFMVEFRKKTGYDTNLYGSYDEGLLVYRINTLETGNSNGPPDEMYVLRPGINENSANGFLGDATLSANKNRMNLNSSTDPMPFLTDGLVSSLNILNVGIIGDSIEFEIKGMEKETICPQYFHPAWEGHAGQDYMNINIVSSKFDGVELAVGDEIGVFDRDLCVGYGKLIETIDNQHILSIVVSRDNGAGDGYIVGNEIEYKFWDCSSEQELGNITPTYYDNDSSWSTTGMFEPGLTAFVALMGKNETCLTLNLNQGWNIFSVNSTPLTSNMLDLFQPFVDRGSMVKIQDEFGSSIENWGIFGGWQNNIGDIAQSEGYKIKLNEKDFLEVCGTPVEYPYLIPLRKGWNIMGYPQTLNYNAMAVVQQLIDNGTLIKVQDQKGSSIEDWGVFGGWQNNIGEFNPGEGYKINLSTDDTLWIYESYPKSSAILPELVATNHFLPEIEGNGVDHMNINLVELSRSFMEPGDELAIFDGSTCVGAITLMPHHISNGRLSITASATDKEGFSGFNEGNLFEIKLWSKQQNREFILEPEIIRGSSTFQKHETTFTSIEKSVTMEIEELNLKEKTEVNCYPIPFSTEITIEINLAGDSKVKVEVINLMGQSVRCISTNRLLPSGIHKLFWDGRNENNAIISSGLYHLKVSVNGTKIYKKIVYSQ